MNQSLSTGFMAVIEFQILPKWFELDSRTQRDYAIQLSQMMKRYKDVDSRWFDTDAWTGEFSDFVICEFENLQEYNDMWSELRRHPFLATPYARIGQVLMGMELETEGLAKLAPEQAFDPPELPPQTPKPLKPVPQGTDDLRLTSCHFCGHQMKVAARYCNRCGTACHP
jgi:hypothetical protein